MYKRQALLWCLRNNAFVAQQMKESVAPATSMAEALSRTKRAVAGTFAFSLICGFVIELDIHNNLQYCLLYTSPRATATRRRIPTHGNRARLAWRQPWPATPTRS